jgi:hypothetical protein
MRAKLLSQLFGGVTGFLGKNQPTPVPEPKVLPTQPQRAYMGVPRLANGCGIRLNARRWAYLLLLLTSAWHVQPTFVSSTGWGCPDAQTSQSWPPQYPASFSGDWSGPIPAGSSQPVTVTFAPTAATSYGGTVTVNADQTSGVNAQTVSGTGMGTISLPQRLTSMIVADGLIRLTVGGPGGANAILEVSSDFISWRAISTNRIPANGSMPMAFSAPTNRVEFYRVQYAP